jgi:hypothetical protein
MQQLVAHPTSKNFKTSSLGHKSMTSIPHFHQETGHPDKKSTMKF